jgi:peptidoglycan biosynthesis protein MviN/MurJ (putative lipid II flippase)
LSAKFVDWLFKGDNMGIIIVFVALCIAVGSVAAVVFLHRIARRRRQHVDIASRRFVVPLIGLLGLCVVLTLMRWYMAANGDDILTWTLWFDVGVIVFSACLIVGYVRFDQAVQDRNHELTSK